MADNDSGEKTEEPTAKRKSEAKRKGNVAKSQEVDYAVSLFVALFVFKIFGSFMMNTIKNYLISIYSELNKPITSLNIQNIAFDSIIFLAKVISPILLFMLISGITSSFIQAGWIFTTESLKWKWDFFNLSKGFGKMFSKETFKNLIKNILKIFVLLFICYLTIRKDILNFMYLVDMDVLQIFNFVTKIILKLLLNILLVYILIATADFIVTKFLHNKKMKMSKQEVKDEFKQMEGDPIIKNKLRSLMMEQSRKRMLEDVPKADVVITNPIHIAVALKYSPDKADAPLVIAKGKRIIAEKIKDAARKNNIPIFEDPPLARLLFKNSVIGKEIPVDLYAAVAEILAQIFKMKNRYN